MKVYLHRDLTNSRKAEKYIGSRVVSLCVVCDRSRPGIRAWTGVQAMVFSLFEVFDSRGSKISKIFPDIIVTTKHTYEIEHKYIYTCTNDSCCREYGRSKRIDVNRNACGSCHSKLMQTRPIPHATTRKEAKSNPFGNFVKEHFANVKKENPTSPHKDIMKILSDRYHGEKLNGGKTLGDPIVLEDSEGKVGELSESLDCLEVF